MVKSEEPESEELCMVPKCPTCEELMLVYFKGGDLSKPAFGHREGVKNCGMYLGGFVCSRSEAIRYPATRPKAIEKRPTSEKPGKRVRSKKKAKFDKEAWANNTLTKFGEPPGLDPNWTGD